MTFAVSPINYVDRPNALTITYSDGYIAKNNYSYCPSALDQGYDYIEITNTSPTILNMDCIVLGNVLAGSTAVSIQSVTLDGYPILSYNIQEGQSSILYNGTLKSPHDYYGTAPSVLKSIPIILSTVAGNLSVSPGSSVRITFDSGLPPIRCGYIWVGPLIILDRKLSKPTKVLQESNTKLIELENGDKIMERTPSVRKINVDLQGLTDKDKTLLQNTLHMGGMFYITSFSPFTTGLCSITDSYQASEEDYSIWREFTALTRLSTNINMLPRFLNYYNITLQFTEVM